MLRNVCAARVCIAQMPQRRFAYARRIVYNFYVGAGKQ